MLVAKLDVADRVVRLDYRQVAAGGGEAAAMACSPRTSTPATSAGGSSTPPDRPHRRSWPTQRHRLGPVVDDDGRRVDDRFAVEGDHYYAILISDGDQPAVWVLTADTAASQATSYLGLFARAIALYPDDVVALRERKACSLIVPPFVGARFGRRSRTRE